jgi:hypothetical protein
MAIIIPNTANVDELRKMLQLLLNYLLDDGLKQEKGFSVNPKLAEATAKAIVQEGMRK